MAQLPPVQHPELASVMTLSQLRSAYEREAERCEAQMLLCRAGDPWWQALRSQRLSVLRLRAAITPVEQLALPL